MVALLRLSLEAKKTLICISLATFFFLDSRYVFGIPRNNNNNKKKEDQLWKDAPLFKQLCVSAVTPLENGEL